MGRARATAPQFLRLAIKLGSDPFLGAPSKGQGVRRFHSSQS